MKLAGQKIPWIADQSASVKDKYSASWNTTAMNTVLFPRKAQDDQKNLIKRTFGTWSANSRKIGGRNFKTSQIKWLSNSARQQQEGNFMKLYYFLA